MATIPEALTLGIQHHQAGRLSAAEEIYRQILQAEPDRAEAIHLLGVIALQSGQYEVAIQHIERAVALQGDVAFFHSNLGAAYRAAHRTSAAIASYRRALELEPDRAEMHNNLGNVLKDQGRLDDATDCYRRALELKSDYAEAHSNILYARLFCPACDPRTLYEEHRQWEQRHAAPLEKPVRPHPNDRSPERRLRIGYVSPNFRDHCQALFTMPLFSAHDRERFPIVCYSDVAQPDAATHRLRALADGWRNIAGMDHQQVADLVRRDSIDVLVDLTMHMAGSRLLVFARKPAPVQACWLAYPGTTGLSAIDYRLTDPCLDPPGLFDGCYAEESFRLPDSFWCYDPLESGPAVGPLPAAEKGFVTFGCLNNFCKVNPGVVRLWARVLKAVEGARLTLLADEGEPRRHVLDLLAQEAVDCRRVGFVASQPRPQYLDYYRGIDIGLDTVPYNGHTTSLDSFWMGVPVVTLVGPTVVGRGGASQLTNLGLPELIAASPDEYVRTAAALAQNLPRLAGLRTGLRARLQKSPLMDAPRFAGSVEAAYRAMWRRWCRG